MQKQRRLETKVGLTLLILAMLGVVSMVATWSAFSDTTANNGNVFQAGSVDIEDNDSGTIALYDLYDGSPEATPGDSDSGCIKVTFNGTLASTVKLYGSNNLNANALDDNLTLKITSGSGPATGGDCAGANFTTTQTAGNVYDGSLANFMSSYNDFGDPLSLDDGNADADTAWGSSDSVTYRFEVTLDDDADVSDANSGTTTGFSTGSHSFTWEARNN